MSLNVQYSKELRKNLSFFPVWQPGDPVSPGDLGELVDGVFYRQTTLQQLFPGLRCKIAEDSSPQTMRFHSERSLVVQTAATGSIPGEVAGAVEASVEITFEREGAVVFHAISTGRYIENLHHVREQISERRTSWPRGYVLASHVEDASRFAVLVSSAAGASVQLRGEIQALRELSIADPSVSVVASRNLGYQTVGSGPVLLRLYGFRLLGRRPRLLSAGDDMTPEAEFAELSARDPAFDG